MGLLADIQADLLNEKPVGPILLKLRYLAARLGSVALEEWVRHESEGYPNDVEVPAYRKFDVTYKASFNGPFGSSVSNISIPSALIVELAGEGWLKTTERQSVSAVEELISSTAESGEKLGIDASNLIFLLGANVFENMVCHSVRGLVSRASLVEMLGTLRARILELTLQLERNIPNAGGIEAGKSSDPSEVGRAAAVTQITNQIINGGISGSNVMNTGDNANINSVIQLPGNVSSLADALKNGGLPDADAEEFAAIVASERPDGIAQPFGNQAKDWIAKNIGKALGGSWKIGAAVATTLLTEAAKRYYGLS